MACDITAGRLRACKNFSGGIDSIFLLNYLDNAFTVSAGNEATAINPLLLAVYEYEIDGDTHNLVQNFVSSKDNGTSVNTQTLTFTLKGVDAPTSAQLNTLIYGKAIVVIKDRNGKYVALGIDDGMDFNVDAVTGSAKGDLSGYTLTGVATTKALAPFLDSATITAFLGKVV
jgi:hypothetical protein